MNAASRQLVLLRHAKAADPSSATDHERPLTERGRADARTMGHWLKRQGVRVDLVLCSTAVRTRETWAELVESSGLGALVDHDPRIYNASVERLLGVVAQDGHSARSIALVGHAPGVPGLAATLTGGDAALDDGFPTCTAAIIEVDVPWKDLAPGTGRLVATHTARSSD
ncbi:SixA phosphatase family protein [Flexivirga caeni]|uniref:Histidine phosphatase family protein n=1 Tax=Flexivirga caeni TaxID=2294115 RepID=A0A3M9M6X4_9MICO|nr:histidine phosphatase family protein [Flexivirga caeni]RNI21282.1 histidine phosphatase family protein [Flexivirga caeni]